jgi:4-aminobutyrate aminotransferase-like enzyme
MARQYFVEIGEPERSVFVARRQSYHGNTLGALAVGGNAWRRRQFAPLLINVQHVAPCYAYRDQRAGESPEAYGARLADELDATVRECGAKRVIAFVAETVGGATSGALLPVPGYFKAIREVCDRHGILLILDEVMCGMGRTGTLHACTQEGVAPDLMTIAKGLGVRADRRRLPQSASSMPCRQVPDSSSTDTYLGHPSDVQRRSPCRKSSSATDCSPTSVHAAALAARLADRFDHHPHVGDIRGRVFSASRSSAIARPKNLRSCAATPRPHQARSMARGL